MPKMEIEGTDKYPRPPLLVCLQECEDVRCSQKFADMSGNLKIVVANPTPCKDCMEQFWAAVLSLGFMMMGIAVFAVLIFAMGDYIDDVKEHLDKLHVSMCTMGFVFYSGSGIIAMSTLHGPTARLKSIGRKIEHILGTIFGILVGVAGGALCLHMKERFDWFGYHCLTGLAAYTLAGFSIITGIGAAAAKKKKILVIFKVLHAVTGILTYVGYIGCFVTGMLYPRFHSWGRRILTWYPWVLIGLVIWFTFIFLLVPFLRCCINFGKCCKLSKRKCSKAQTRAYILAEKQKAAYLKELEEERVAGEKKLAEDNRLAEEKDRKANPAKYKNVPKPPKTRK